MAITNSTKKHDKLKVTKCQIRSTRQDQMVLKDGTLSMNQKTCNYIKRFLKIRTYNFFK